MSLFLILIAVTLGVFRNDIKGLESFSISSEVPKISYELVTKDKNNDRLDSLNYEPNVHSFTGLSVSNKYTSATISFQNKDNDKKDIEASKLFDLQFLGHYENYLWEIYYQNYQGLYITDSKLLSSDLPKANSWSYGTGVKYFSKEGFKLKSSHGNFSENKKTDWSWVQGVFINKSRLFSSDKLIPDQYAANFSQLVGLKAIDASTIGVEFGVSGLYSKEKFFADALMSIGWHLQRQAFSGSTITDRTITEVSTAVITGIGYDSKKWGSLGLQLRAQIIQIPVQNAQFSQQRAISSLYYKYFF